MDHRAGGTGHGQVGEIAFIAKLRFPGFGISRNSLGDPLNFGRRILAILIAINRRFGIEVFSSFN